MLLLLLLLVLLALLLLVLVLPGGAKLRRGRSECWPAEVRASLHSNARKAHRATAQQRCRHRPASESQLAC